MPIFTKVSGAWKTVEAPNIGVRVGGAWKAVALAFVRVSGTWKELTPLTVSVDTTILAGGGAGNGPFNTSQVHAGAIGGVAPYIYLWEFVSGAPFGVISPNDGNLASIYFVGTATAPTTKSAVWHCKVTDSVGTIAYTGNVTANFAFT